MDSSISPTSALDARLALLQSRGVLEALVCSLVATGIGLAYGRLRSGIADGASIDNENTSSTRW